MRPDRLTLRPRGLGLASRAVMTDPKVRFAVVGLGNIAQTAVLPAFEHAHERCELVALVSSDHTKLSQLSRAYEIRHHGSYDDLERIFEEADVDAAYIALPNTEHRSFTERCARAGVHVLCEKPMAVTEEDCEAMIRVCEENDAKLMIAYRLHFDPANLHAIDIAQSGRIGELRFFSSTFGQQVREGDIRTRPELGGGALFDMGVYCVNAARYLFRDEPEEVFAMQSGAHDDRLHGVDETTTAILRFPGDRLAQLTCSQACARVDEYRIVGTRGDLRVEPAYTYSGELTHHLTVDGETKRHRFAASDQFAPELLYFAQCIVDDEDPEPSGDEGLADVRVLEAIAESARSSRPVRLPHLARSRRPGLELERREPPLRSTRTVRAPSPSK
jgi:predicted dehydrogenase